MTSYVKITCLDCGHGAHNRHCDACRAEGPKFWRSGHDHEFVPDWEVFERELNDALSEVTP